MLAMHEELQSFAKTIVYACGNAMQRPHMKSMDNLDMIEGGVLPDLPNQAMCKCWKKTFLLLATRLTCLVSSHSLEKEMDVD